MPVCTGDNCVEDWAGVNYYGRMRIEQQIKERALELGFDAVGITTAEPVEATHVERFQAWLAASHAAEMGYMHRNTDKRFDPAKLLTGAKSVICVALNYRPECGRSFQLRSGCSKRAIPKQDASATLRIANFAQYEDYHPFIKERLFKLAEFTAARSASAGIEFKACVDSVPIAERALAQRAGLGFIGRNHMLIHPELGNQILLGELITTLELDPDEPMADVFCGDCGKCIRACPTGALGFDGSFDARKCISYQTIEAPATARQRKLPDCDRDGHIPNYIFGCDECILACPHETGKPPRRNMDFQHHPEWQELTPDQIQNMTEDDFQKTFAGSGFIRLGLDRLKRNCAAV